jgi:hypothetical protein
MRRTTTTAALLTALALGVIGPPATAAAQPLGIDAPAPPIPAPPIPAPPIPAPPNPAPPSDDVAECLDGNCTLRVTRPVEIKLDGRAGPTGLSVSIGPDVVSFRVQSPSGNGLGTAGRGGTVGFGSERGTLTVRVLELGPDAAVIELSTQPA